MWIGLLFRCYHGFYTLFDSVRMTSSMFLHVYYVHGTFYIGSVPVKENKGVVYLLVRIDPLHFLAGCRTRRRNQALCSLLA